MRNILTVFIASPSDLADERKRTFEVVAEINQVIKNLDWSIDLLGWEDTLPGYGCPQAIINRDVEQCQLFIGLLWRTWGTQPALDSMYSSGFHEEFSIARARRERTLSPELWMFFKTVEPAQRADAGAQLQRVIDFRDSLIAGKAVLFKEFASVDDWEKMLRRYLMGHIFSIAKIQGASAEGPSGPATSGNATPTDAGQGAPAAGRQIAELADSLAPAFQTGNLGDITTKLGDANDASFLAVRVLLLSAALIAASGTSETPLPIHELNTLYRHRDRLLATEDEIYVLLKTVLVEEFDLKPGWYWFRDDTPESIRQSLGFMAWFEHETKLSAKAFEILRRTKTGIFQGVHRKVLELSLRKLPADLREAAWAYLVDVATREDVTALRESATNSWLAVRIDWLQSWTETGRNLNAFLPGVPDPKLVSEPLKQSILAGISDLTDLSLQALSSMPDPELRESALAELRTRGTPVGEEGKTPEAVGRGAAVSSLLSVSGSADPDKAEYERLNRENNEGLRKSLNWYTVDGWTSYRILIERGEISRDAVRKDLSEKFRRISDDSYQMLEQTVGSQGAAGTREVVEKHREFITRRFTAVAFAALAMEPSPEDIVLARQFLNGPSTPSGALRIVASKGSAADVKDLMEIARSSYGEQRTLALIGVIRLTENRLETAQILVASDVRELCRAGLRLMRNVPDEDALPFLEGRLLDADEDVRALAVGALVRRCTRGSLIEVLNRYTSHNTYFYNVVVRLDRRIYAPAPISSYYQNELDTKMKALNRPG